MTGTPAITPGETSSASSRLRIRWRPPVLEGTGYRSAREKLQQAMRALQIGNVDTMLAVAEFSQLYRTLSPGQKLEMSVTVDAAEATLQLQTELTVEEADQRMPALGHFKSRRDIATAPGMCVLDWVHRYRLQGPPDIQGAQTWIERKGSEEILLQANQTAAALSTTQSRLTSVQEDLKIASAIQQRMLVSESKLQAVSSGLDCYAYMVPCREIGGDFYDLIPLDADHIAVVVGDVSGKGIPAAMMMATCITLLRAYTESFRSASRIMRKVNPRLIDGNEQDCMFTTLFLGIINLHRHTLTYCNAGHNPAILQRADGSIHRLDDIHGPAVGVMEGVEYEETRVPFHASDRLLLYTDGVSERFNAQGDLFGEERLISYCSRSPMDTKSQRVLANLLEELEQFSGSELAHDDVTVVYIKRLADANHDLAHLHQERLADHRGMAELMNCAEEFCQKHGISPEVSSRLQLILDELMMNVVSYGGGETARLPSMSLNLRLQSNLLVVELRDTGKPFNPFALAEPDTDLTLEERDLGGLGVFLVRSLAQSFSYNYEAPHNCVRLEITCTSSDQPPLAADQ